MFLYKYDTMTTMTVSGIEQLSWEILWQRSFGFIPLNLDQTPIFQFKKRKKITVKKKGGKTLEQPFSAETHTL